MMIYDKGLLRAMKAAYREEGYDVAMTETGILIQAEGWGVEIASAVIPNSIKSLIVLHNGAMPRMGSAVHVQKGECSGVILETVTGTMDHLAEDYTAKGGKVIKPTRLTFDNKRVWQVADSLEVRLVAGENLQILDGGKWDARLVSGCIYGRNQVGATYIRTEAVLPEDKVLLDHLAQMQWIPVEFWD